MLPPSYPQAVGAGALSVVPVPAAAAHPVAGSTAASAVPVLAAAAHPAAGSTTASAVPVPAELAPAAAAHPAEGGAAASAGPVFADLLPAAAAMPPRNCSATVAASDEAAVKLLSGGAEGLLEGPLAAPEIAAYVRELSRKPHLSFPAMAELAAERFGCTGPSAAQIAAFLGRTLSGKSSLNRIGRDPELVDWLIRNGATGRLSDIHAACVRAFSPDRAPSLTAIGTFLRAAGRRGRHGDVRRLDFDPEVAAWLRTEATAHNLDTVRAGCAARYGAERTPSRSGLLRFLRAAGITPLDCRGRIAQDAEVGEWLAEHASCLKIAELHAGCLARFGAARTPGRSTIRRFLARRLVGVSAQHATRAKRPEVLRAPSRSALHRHLSRRGGAACAGRRSRMDRDAEVADWLRANAAGQTLDELHAASAERFGAARTPSRSALHRFLSRQAGGKLTSRKSRMDRDAEVAEWLRANAAGQTLDELHAAIAERFGAAHTPSRSALHRFLARQADGKLTSRKSRMDRDAEVAGWLRANAAGQTLEELRAAIAERFGAARTPGRSTLHRFLSRLRRAAYPPAVAP